MKGKRKAKKYKNKAMPIALKTTTGKLLNLLNNDGLNYMTSLNSFYITGYSTVLILYLCVFGFSQILGL